jgi:hypothetical protein
MSYQKHYNHSIEKPQEFWKEQSDNLKWYKKPQTILSKDENGFDSEKWKDWNSEQDAGKRLLDKVNKTDISVHENRLEIADFLSGKDFSFVFRLAFNKAVFSGDSLSKEDATGNLSINRIKSALFNSGHNLFDFWDKFADKRFINYSKLS